MGFSLKHLWQELKKKFHSSLGQVSQFFLGPDQNHSIDIKKTSLSISREDDDDHEELNNVIKSGAYEHQILLFSACPDVFLKESLLFKPRFIEQVPVMLEEALKSVPIQMVIIDHISALPTRTHWQKTSISCRFHDEEMMLMFKRIRSMQIEHGFLMVILEHEYTLGEKNSALLRRMMNT